MYRGREYGTMGERRFCPNCGDQRDVVQTVSWQADLCGTCGNELPED